MQHVEVPSPGVKSELKMLAYTTATATPDPNCVYDLDHSLQQCQTLNPMKTRDCTHILMDTSLLCYHWGTMRTPLPITYIVGDTCYFLLWSYRNSKAKSIVNSGSLPVVTEKRSIRLDWQMKILSRCPMNGVWLGFKSEFTLSIQDYNYM